MFAVIGHRFMSASRTKLLAAFALLAIAISTFGRAAASRERRMRSRTIVSLALFVLAALALPLIISRHGSQANSPATRVPKLTTRLASDDLVKASQTQSTQPLLSLQGKPANDYLKEHGLYVRLQNLIEAAQYQQPQAQEVSALRSGPLLTQTKKLTASDAAAEDRFGYSVATNGDTLVVGAYGKNWQPGVAPTFVPISKGAAYIFVRNQGGAENWGQVKILTPGDAAANDRFGWSVAIDVDTVVVGALVKDSNRGAAYIFGRNQGGTGNWGQVKKLTASDAAGGDQLGSSVSVNADTVVVGAYGSVPSANYISTGAAYVFKRNQGGAENWGQVKKLTASDGAANHAYFGYSASINGDTVVIGASGKNPGAAYIFERNHGGAENWGPMTKLTASDGVGGDQFGASVAINIDTVAVGATHGNRGTSGAVYIFKRNQGGTQNWGQVQELTASDANLLDEFGISVGIDGDTLVVGAWALNLATGGAAYIFERNQNGVEGWGQVQKLTASDAAAHDQFGSSVGIEGDTVVVGAGGKNSNTGAAYTFELPSPPTPSPTPSPTPPANASCSFTANLGSPPAPATTGTMTTRLFRGESQGKCGTNSFPGNSGAGSFPFDAYTLTNSSPSPVCVSAALTVNSKSNANYQIAAFLAPFVATDITNASRYLGDPGVSSGIPPLTKSFQFTVPGNTSFAIVVFAVNGTAELGGSYTFQVMSLSSFCPVPTPAATPPATQGTAVAYQIDAAHTGAQFDTVVPPLVQRWSRDLGGQISYPLIVGGRIFVTVANPASYGIKLYALDEANGATLWGPVDLGGNYGWSNAAYDSGRVFAVNFDGLLRAFDAASGALIWSKQLPDAYAFSSPPTASGGVVYVLGAGSLSASGSGTLYAVDEQDGTVKWSVLLQNGGDDSSPAVTSTGVFVAAACNHVYDFSPQDGSLIWQHPGPCTGGGGSTPVLFGGRLHVGDSLTEKLMFDAPTGAVLGTFPPGPPPAFSGSTGFFLTGSILRARDAYSGATRWSFTGDGTLISAPIVVNGYVYIGSSSGKVYALDGSTGANVWTGNLGAAVQTTESPVTRPHTGLGAGDGLVVVPASNLLVAYQSSPRLITNDDNHAIAVDSVTLVRDPFSVVGSHNFSLDQRTRVMIFTSNLGLKQPSSDLSVTAGGIPLTVEAVGTLAGVSGISYIIVKLDPMLSGNVSVSVTFRGLTSNAGVLSISP